MHRLN